MAINSREVNENGVNPHVILKNFLSDNVSSQFIVSPFADDHDVILGQNCHTCGMIRIPLLDDDAYSPERMMVAGTGKQVKVRDVYLSHEKYMTYYMREYIIDREHNAVESTEDGHYGDWLTTDEIIAGMQLGNVILEKARNIDKQQQEKEAQNFFRKNHAGRPKQISNLDPDSFDAVSVNFLK